MEPTTSLKGAMSSASMETISERLSELENLYFPRAVQSSAVNPSQRKSLLLDLLSRDVPVFLGILSSLFVYLYLYMYIYVYMLTNVQ